MSVSLAILNPIALRMAKTLLSFGHSECYRVKIYTFRGNNNSAIFNSASH